MIEPSTQEILKVLTEIAEISKICRNNSCDKEKNRITEVFLDALILKLSFYNVLFGGKKESK